MTLTRMFAGVAQTPQERRVNSDDAAWQTVSRTPLLKIVRLANFVTYSLAAVYMVAVVFLGWPVTPGIGLLFAYSALYVALHELLKLLDLLAAAA